MSGARVVSREVTIEDVVFVVGDREREMKVVRRGRPRGAVHATVRASVDRMDVDREVAGQISAVDVLLPDICASAAAHCGGLR